jgi:glycosyltransferase involved in cell wall biosynthesis
MNERPAANESAEGKMHPSVPAPDLSVVIPVLNEAPNLEPLHRELTESLGRLGRPYELIFVDDGSTDESFETLARLQRDDPRVRVAQLRRTFGQTAAFAAGFALARGAIIVTADGDGQNDPADIGALTRRLDQGFDVVCGWRQNRKDPFLSRRLPSHIANRLISWATGVRLNDYGCSLKAFRAEVLKPLRLYGEMHRFLPALAGEIGARIGELPVNHRARRAGRSKYGLGRTFRVMLDLLTVKFLASYATRPLQIFGLVGGVMGLAGAILLGVLGYQKIVLQVELANRPIVLLGILLVFTGVQLVTLGLLAEMLARTYHESQGKPIYVIRQVLPPAEPGNH